LNICKEHNQMSRPSARILTTALLVSTLFAAAAHAAPSAEGIVVYNAQHESLTKSWVEGFTKETGIKVTVRNGSDSEMGNQIVQEGASSPADVFLTENSPAMVLVDNATCWPRWSQHPGAG
jgi:iron(III) transport system substrate-binding protein